MLPMSMEYHIEKYLNQKFQYQLTRPLTNCVVSTQLGICERVLHNIEEWANWMMISMQVQIQRILE